MSTDRVNFRTSKDWVALDWDEAQEVKHRLWLFPGGQTAADEIQRGIDSRTTVLIPENRGSIAVEVLDAWLGEAGPEALSSEVRVLRAAFARDLQR